MEIKEIKLDDLIEMDDITYNDIQKKNSLEKSIRRFGQMQLIVVDADNNILGGHRIRRAMKALGFKTAFCVVSPSKDRMISVLLNGVNFSTKDVAIADVVIDSNLSKHDLYHSLPYKTYEVDAFIAIKVWDWSQYEDEKQKNQTDLFSEPKEAE